MNTLLNKTAPDLPSTSQDPAEASFPQNHPNASKRLLKACDIAYEKSRSDQELGAALRDTLSQHGVNEVITFFEERILTGHKNIVGVSTISFYAIALVLSNQISKAVEVVSQFFSEADYQKPEYLPASICLSAAHEQFDNARDALALMKENTLSKQNGKERRFASTLCALFLESPLPQIGVELIQALDVEELGGLKSRFQNEKRNSDGLNCAASVQILETELERRQESPLESLIKMEQRVFHAGEYENWLELAVTLSKKNNSQATIDLLTERAKFLINDGQSIVVSFIDRCIKNYGHNLNLIKTFGELIETALAANQPKIAVDIALIFQSRNDQKFADYVRAVLSTEEVSPAFLKFLDSLCLLIPTTKFRTAVSEYYFERKEDGKALSFWDNFRQLNRSSRNSLLSIAPDETARKLRRSSWSRASKLDSSLSNLSELLDHKQEDAVWKQLAPCIAILESPDARKLPHSILFRITHSYARFAGLTLNPEHFNRLNRLVEHLSHENLISKSQAEALYITAGSMRETTSVAKAMDNDRSLMAQKGRSIIFVPHSKNYLPRKQN